MQPPSDAPRGARVRTLDSASAGASLARSQTVVMARRSDEQASGRSCRRRAGGPRAPRLRCPRALATASEAEAVQRDPRAGGAGRLGSEMILAASEVLAHQP